MKLNRYEKILARPDKRRPFFVSETTSVKALKYLQQGMVLNIKILHPNGDITIFSWSEKSANKMLEIDNKNLRIKNG